MTTVQEFYEIKEKNEQRLSEITKKIEANKIRLPQLQEEYKLALSKLDDKKVDKLYTEIQELKKSLAADEYNLSAMKEANASLIKEKAGEVLGQALLIRQKHENIIKERIKEVQQLRKEYAAKVLDILNLPDDYEAELSVYSDIYRLFDWKDAELTAATGKDGWELKRILENARPLGVPTNDLDVDVFNVYQIAKGESK
ncbi:hypothetical protein [Virgibacillus pantothenticus]|uniref:hypothetical protein n=1 Tax=Virgibacillus pantothenticus TaxID=1473 RepID=UPI0025B27696|nr:hypothetical protein [Virgibacillus pantothenticus]